MSTAQLWGPGLIGLTVAMALYGVSIGQFAFYVRAFPRDMVQLKSLVFVVFISDNIQSFAMIRAYHHILIHCLSNSSTECIIYMPTSLILGMCIIYCVTFMVQCFYAHRVWIISNRNYVITSSVIASAFAQLMFGLLCTASLIHTPTYQVAFTLKFPPLSAVASALCDFLITISIYYYLRPARTGVNRRDNYIKKLIFIFVQMGVLSFINASAVAVAYYVQDHQLSQLLIAAPGAILSKTYVNSMFSVLNARKPIREEREAQALRTIPVPTLSTIQ